MNASDEAHTRDQKREHSSVELLAGSNSRIDSHVEGEAAQDEDAHVENDV